MFTDSTKHKGKVKFRFLIYFVVALALCILASSLLWGYYCKNRSNTDYSSDKQEVAAVDDISGVYSVQGVDYVSDFYEGEAVVEDNESGDKSTSDSKRKVYLTFDDGPSIYTNQILDILKEYDVKATFFVVAREDAKSIDCYKRIVEEGHTLAMHSYNHKYSEVYSSLEGFKEDVRKLQEFLYDCTGVWPRIYRFPGGSSNHVSKVPIEDLINYLDESGIVYYDWNLASQDAMSSKQLSEETLTENCLKDIDKHDECIILMHDSALRKTSVDALDNIIEGIMSRGDCVILPITDDTPPIQHRKVKK